MGLWFVSEARAAGYRGVSPKIGGRGNGLLLRPRGPRRGCTPGTHLRCHPLTCPPAASLEFMVNLLNWQYWLGYDNCRSFLFDLCTRNRMSRA